MPSKSTGRTPWFLYSTHIRAICMQFTSLFCQRLYPFITATQPSKNLEPVAALVRLFHCYCNFMDKVITAFRSIGLMVIGTYRTGTLAKLMRNDLGRYIIRSFTQIFEHLHRIFRRPILQHLSKLSIRHDSTPPLQTLNSPTSTSPPSRRTQQKQGFQRSGADVSRLN